MAIDSKGNAWITNTIGSGLTLETKASLLYLKLYGKSLAAIDKVALGDLLSHPGLGSVSMLRPDGSPAPGSPFNPGSIWGAWAVSIDGNGHVWVSNFAPGPPEVRLKTHYVFTRRKISKGKAAKGRRPLYLLEFMPPMAV